MLLFRHAILDDVPTLQYLFVETIKKSCKKEYTTEQLNAWAASIQYKKRWIEAITNQYFLVAEYKGLAIGFASLDHGNYIDFLYVHHTYLRKGVATLLYQHLAQESKRLGHHQITTHTSYIAKPFFKKQGFQSIQEQTHQVNGISISNIYMSYIDTKHL